MQAEDPAWKPGGEFMTKSGVARGLHFLTCKMIGQAETPAPPLLGKHQHLTLAGTSVLNFHIGACFILVGQAVSPAR